jgi:hypothetical protein
MYSDLNNKNEYKKQKLNFTVLIGGKYESSSTKSYQRKCRN